MSRKRTGSADEALRTRNSEDDREPDDQGFTRLQRFNLQVIRIQERARLFALFIRCTMVVIVVYFTMDATKALAGQTTIAQIVVKLLANQGFSQTVAWLFGLGGVGFGVRERRLRHKDTKQLAGRLQEYETKIDPGRRSSKLGSQGDYGEDD